MSISVTCPDCEHTFSVKDEYAGKRGKCPRCNGVFRAVATETADTEIPAVLAARSGVALGAVAKGGSSAGNGSLAIDPNGTRPSAAGKAGKKSGGQKKKSARRDPDAAAMPVWGWITLAVVLAAGFVGGGLVYMARAKDALKIAERVDDGSEAEATKQKLLDEIKALEDELSKLKANLVAAEKAIGSKPKEKDPFGEIEKRIIPGAVKIIPYVNDQPGEKTATGFLMDVNGKTLIATTHRVCEGATKLGVKLVTGTEYEVEGIVAASDKKDIAILKPKGEMPGSKPLTIAENAQLHRGDTVYAIGNPARQEFTTSRGVVTRIVSQDKYFDETPMFDIALRRETAANPEYIEHDARIFGGDYGGPLLNTNLEVVGMNQVLITMRLNDGRSIVQTYGAAKQISEVKALAATATDAIKPYPPAAKEDKQPEPKDDAAPPDDKDDEAKPDDAKPDDAKPDDAKPDDAKPDDDGGDAPKDEPKDDNTPEAGDLAGKIDALFTECDGFDWKPTSGEQYGKLCNIARRVTEAKLLTDGDAGKEAATEAADKVLKRLGDAGWGTTEVEAVNKLAAALEPSEDAGICFVGKAMGATNFNNSPALIFHVEGTESVCIVPSEKAAEIPPGTRGIVLGKFASPQKLKLKNPQDNKEYTATLVTSKGLVTLK